MHTSIQKTPNKIVYNFNQNGDCNNEWDDLQSQFFKYTQKHKISGWENLFSKEIINNVSIPKKNALITNLKEIKPYDLKYENNKKSKDKYLKNN